jgi:hypothetical protein
MTQAKLTVRVDDRWIEPAKQYAARRRTTLSRLISAYLHALSLQETPFTGAPVLERLTGILPSDVDVEAHHRYLEEKHRGG